MIRVFRVDEPVTKLLTVTAHFGEAARTAGLELINGAEKVLIDHGGRTFEIKICDEDHTRP